ncbi:hypothetical protein OG259_41360 (plasmid) [Streptomyces sp. NBC_00250]|uniref:hypothetical protein n=1 Tax=Streptomyces sp. NBC_00250 TaxID=2903641 RepID=UPI002E291980|nr:hypothetical protein [Streptomyces sp. NBC_00250]
MSELRGRTEEANAPAVTWLRKVTAGVQVRVLAETFPYSKSVWSEYRNGAKLIPEQLLNDVVDTLVSDTEMRERQRAEGRRLLEAAQKAVRRPAARPAPQASPGIPDRPSMPAGVGEVLLRLDDARLQQIEAMRKLADSEKRCSQLQEMVSVLQNQCAQLTEERDHARLEAHGAHELQAALEQSEMYREQAEGQLRHARKATEQAFELRLAAEANVARVQADARRTTGAAQGAGRLLPQPAGVGLDLPPLERIGEVLQAVQDQLVEQDEGLDELRSHLGVGGPVVADAAAPHVITGQVVARQDDLTVDSGIVHADPGDNRDNAVTSTDIATSTGRSVVVQTLSTALSPADLGRAVGMLRVRAGIEGWPVERMNAQADGGRLSSESRQVDNSVDGWLDGSQFPKLYWALDALIDALGATDGEKAAFFSSYVRIARRESEAFKEAYPRIERQGDESFESASRRVTEAEARARQEAAQHGRSPLAPNAIRIEAERNAPSLDDEQPHVAEPALSGSAPELSESPAPSSATGTQPDDENVSPGVSVVPGPPVNDVDDVDDVADALRGPDNFPAPPTPLTIALAGASDARQFGAQIEALRQRAGVGRADWSHARLASEVSQGFATRKARRAVKQWLAGKVLPSWSRLRPLLIAMGAGKGELAAFEEALRRVSHTATVMADPAEMMRRRSRRSDLIWLTALTCTAVFATAAATGILLSATYSADPVQPLWKPLIAILLNAVLAVGARTVLHRLYDRWVPGLVLLGWLLTLLTGYALPLLTDHDYGGRALADFIGFL